MTHHDPQAESAPATPAATDPSPGAPRSRRAILAAAAAAAATWTLGSFDPEPVAAAGTMQFGALNDASNAATLLTSSSTQLTLDVANTNGGEALHITSSRLALWARTTPVATGPTTGAWIQNGAVTAGWGVMASIQDGTGVLGYSGPSWNSVALYDLARANTGVYGYAPTGTGVYARSGSGVALRVSGKAQFTRSKRVSMAAGTSSLKVSLAGVTTSSYVLATLQSRRTGYYVSSVVCGTDSFTIYLNKALTSKTTVAYFVIN